VSLAIWDHTVLPATRYKWTHPEFIQLLKVFHGTATECHLAYGITQYYLLPDTSEHTPSLFRVYSVTQSNDWTRSAPSTRCHGTPKPLLRLTRNVLPPVRVHPSQPSRTCRLGGRPRNSLPVKCWALIGQTGGNYHIHLGRWNCSEVLRWTRCSHAPVRTGTTTWTRSRKAINAYRTQRV